MIDTLSAHASSRERLSCKLLKDFLVFSGDAILYSLEDGKISCIDVFHIQVVRI